MQVQTLSLMSDPRVRRGFTNTLATTQLVQTMRQPVEQRRVVARPSKQTLIEQGRIRPTLPSIESISQNIVVQKTRHAVPLHLFLEDQTPSVQTRDVNINTDAFLPVGVLISASPHPSHSILSCEQERPVASFIPPKTGVDAFSQTDSIDIYSSVLGQQPSQLFDFDAEMEQLISSLCDRTLAQSQREVQEETTVQAMRDAEDRLLELDSEYQTSIDAALQRAHGIEKNRQRLIDEARAEHAENCKLQAKMAAQYTAVHMLGALASQVSSSRQTTAPPQTASVAQYLQQSMHVATATLRQVSETRQIIDSLAVTALDSLNLRVQAQRTIYQEEELARRAQAEAAAAAEHDKQERARKFALFIHTTLVPESQSPLGPMSVRGSMTLVELEDLVYEQLADVLGDAAPSRDRLRLRVADHLVLENAPGVDAQRLQAWTDLKQQLAVGAVTQDALQPEQLQLLNELSRIIDESMQMQIYDLGMRSLTTISVDIIEPIAAVSAVKPDDEDSGIEE